jgi:membrane protein
VVVGVFLLPMLVLGPDLIRRLFPRSVRPTVSTLLSTGYYPLLIFVLLVGLTVFYRLAPPRRLPWLRGIPGAVFAVLVFLAGSAGLRAYIRFILDRNRAYGTLAAPIAALLFFFVLALGVLLGAELNAAVEQLRPTKARPPRVLDPRSWQVFQPNRDAAAEATTLRLPDVAPGSSGASGPPGPAPPGQAASP